MSTKFKVTSLALCGVIAALGAIVWTASWEQPPPGPGTQPGSPPGEENGTDGPRIDVLRTEAYELQRQQKWCEARDKWNEVLPVAKESNEGLIEAETNLKLVSGFCEPGRKPVSELKVPEPPEYQRPAEIPEADLVSFYPDGRQIRSIGFANISGRGVNEKWVFKGESNFVYQYRVEASSTVKENSGTAVEFDIQFGDVVQLRASSQRTLELKMPESPLLAVVWPKIEQNLLNHVPVYQQVKTLGSIGTVLDPNAKRTLTYLSEILRSGDVKLGDDVELATQIEQLSGLHVEMEYVSGLGVTYIKVLDGEQIDPDDLERLAVNSGVLMDYFVSEAAAHQNEPFQVRVEDVSGLVSLGYDVTPRGYLELQAQKAVAGADKNDVTMKISGGEISVEGNVDGVHTSGYLKPEEGVVHYDAQSKFVRSAKIGWQGRSEWFTTNHLLFGTKKLRQVKLETYYDANMVSGTEAEADE